MPSGGSHFKRALYVVLAAHVGKVGVVFHAVCVELLARVDFGRLHFGFAVEEFGHLAQVSCPVHLKRVYGSCLAGVGFGHNQAVELGGARMYGYRQRTSYGAQRSVEPQFAYEHVALQAVAVHSSLCRKNSQGKRQIIARAFLADVGGGQVDGDLVCGKNETRVV